MAIRANWKGYLKIGELTCPVALHTAVSTAERIAFHTLNRATGHRVHREFVDAESGDPVPREAQAKGYEIAKDQYVMLEPDEIAAAVPESDKTLRVEAFIACGDIDDVYFDRPYYLVPGSADAEAFAVIREGMGRTGTAALARCVLFRRVRSLLVRPHELGLIATTLKFDYEVRSAKKAFADVAKAKVKGEMLELANHIIATKTGEFDPAGFEDRYEKAVAELVRAKLEGKPIELRKKREAAKVIDLMDALRRSAAAARSRPSPEAARRDGEKAGKRASSGRQKGAKKPGPAHARRAGAHGAARRRTG